MNHREALTKMNMNYLTVQEAAGILKLSPWTIRQWLTRGHLKRYKAGGATRIDEEELRSLVRAETREESAARNSRRERTRADHA